MTEASTNKGNPIRRWFANRLEHRIDRLWLGGVVLINAVVWALLGPQYIATFLIGYFFIFTLYYRHEIKTAYHPSGYVLYGIDSVVAYHNCSPKGASGILLLWVVLAVTIYDVLPRLEIHVPPYLVAVVMTTIYANYLFLFKHKALFCGYGGDCAGYGTMECMRRSDKIIMGLIRFLRWIGLVLAVLVVVLLFCWMLWMLTQGIHGLFAPFGGGASWLGSVVAHAFYNALLFDSILITLLTLEKR